MDRSTGYALLALRVTIGVFVLVWAVDKLVQPGTAQQILSVFYGIEAPKSAAYALGIAQIVLGLAFLAGLAKTFTYGAVLVMHLATIAATLPQLLAPYAANNHLFHASIPTLGAMLALFLLRHRDTLATLPALISGRVAEARS